MIDFGIDFLAILAPFWEASGDHVGHQGAAKAPPRRSKALLGRVQDGPETPKEGTNHPIRPKAPPGRFKILPGVDFWRFFCMIF